MSTVSIQKNSSRDWVLNFQRNIEGLKDKVGQVGFESLKEVYVGDEAKNNNAFPLKHSFGDKIYIREMFIPKDGVVIGEIHKFNHSAFFLKGKKIVYNESGESDLIESPLSLITKAGTKRTGIAIEDCIWVTVHQNPMNITDIKKLEDYLYAKDFDDYENFKRIQRKPVLRTVSKLINYFKYN